MAEQPGEARVPGHRILGVSQGASPDEAHRAFRRYALAHHPDRGGDAAEFQAGVEAYRSIVGRGVSGAEADVVFHRKRRGLRIPAFRPWRRRAKRGGK